MASLGPLDGEGWQAIRFDPAQLSIPPLTWRSSRVLGLPLPPGLMISIEPEQLQGQWHPSSGEVQLEFHSRFYFSLGGLYKAPPLIVQTRLHTETAQGNRHHARGNGLGPMAWPYWSGSPRCPRRATAGWIAFWGCPMRPWH